MILLTMIFGATFLGVKAIEYTDKYNHGLVPVTGWNKKSQGTGCRSIGESTKPCWERRSRRGARLRTIRTVNFNGRTVRWQRLAEEGNFLTEAEKIGYFLERRDRWQQVSRQGPDLLLSIFRNDRPARAAHDRRARSDDVAAVDGVEGQLQCRILHAGRDVRASIGTLSISSGYSCSRCFICLGRHFMH